MAGRFADFHLSEFVSFSGAGEKLLVPGRDSLVGSFFRSKLQGAMKDVPDSRLVYFREDCQELYGALFKTTRLVYLGNPGIGKSLSGIQLLFLLVTLHSSRPTVYCAEDRYYLFEKGKFASVLDFDAVLPYLESLDTFYIHDGSAVRSPKSVAARAVLITSPDPDVYKGFGKVSGGYTTFYGRLWTLEELKTCREHAYPELPWEVVLEHVRVAGPVPRLVFQVQMSFQTVRTKMKSKLARTTDLLALFASIGEHDMDKTFSHVLLHLDRGSNAWEGYIKFVSEYVKEQLLLRLEKEKWLQMIDQYSNLRTGDLAFFRGTVMELLMHMTFPKVLGKCQRICETRHKHSAGGIAKLDVDPTEDLRIIFYVDFDDLRAKIEKCIAQKTAAAYFWPRSKNEAAIDSIYIDFKREQAYLLQSTVSKRHAVVWQPVKLLLEFLTGMKIGIVGLFFVVADSNFTAFDAQGWRRTRKVKDEYPDTTSMPSLCQYKVEFTVFDDDWKNMERLSESLQSMDHGFEQKLVREKDMPVDHVHKRKRVEAAPLDKVPVCQLNKHDLDLAPDEYEQYNDHVLEEGIGA